MGRFFFFPSNVFLSVLYSKHGLWSYVKAVDGVWGPPQSPVSQAEKVQSTTGDSWHSVPAKMQPPSPNRQPNTFDVSSGHSRWTQAYPRYEMKTYFFIFSLHFRVGAMGEGVWVEWIQSSENQNGGWRLHVSLAELSSGRRTSSLSLPTERFFLVNRNKLDTRAQVAV